MGLFFPSDDDKLPPGRRKGFPRYTQLLGRDFKQLFLMDLLTLASFIPYGLGVGYAVLSQSVLVLIPVCIIGMIFWGAMGLVGPIILFGLLIAQCASLIATQTNSALHDLIAATVVVDRNSQMICHSSEDLIEYQKQVAAELAARATY